MAYHAYKNRAFEPIELSSFVDHLRETSSNIIEEIERNNQRLVTTINRRLLVRLSQFCRVDLHAYYGFHWCPEAVEVDARSQQRTSDTKRTQASLDWPLLAFIYYLYACAKLCLNIYLQYVYDYHLYQLEYSQVRLNNNSLAVNPTKLSPQTDHSKLGRLKEAERAVRCLGAPFYRTSYFVEVFGEFIAVMSFLTYIDGQMCFRYLCPADFRFARLILFPRQEQLNYIQLVCKEVNKFIASSRNFSSTYLDELDINFEHSGHEIIETNTASVCDSVLDQVICLNQLKRLALYDQLRPLNWSPGWTDRLSTYYCLFTVTCIAWALSILFVTLLASPLLHDIILDELSPLDYLVVLECGSIITFLIIALTFYASLIFLTCLDQIFYVNKLRLLIEERLQQNRQKHHRLVESEKHYINQTTKNNNNIVENELKLATMNCNLLYCFMHYRVFVGQFKSHRKTFEPIVLHAIIIWFFLPIVARLHAPYIAHQAKLVQLYICLSICVVVNFVLVPICHLYGCSLRLYKSLSSLLANTIETQSIGPNNLMDETTRTTRKSLYNLHLIGLLRKELNESDIFMNQFATTCIGLHLSYPTVVKFHFWLGLILLSLISGVTSGNDSLFGSSLSDPFGLFA